MSSPNADLPVLMGLYQSKIVQEGSTGDGIGTGPFVMESFQPGVKSVHVRNNNYFRDGLNLDAVEIIAIIDPVARVNALLAGDMQIVSNVNPQAFRQIESSSTATLLSVPAELQMGICCLKNAEPGNNDDFALGMKYIQDRERIHKGKEKHARVAEILEMVELPAAFASRYPMELSGGQKQRINMARSLAANPEVMLCDEVTSALDSIVGANVIKLLTALRDKTGVSFVFISHDLSTVASFADQIVVLYAGRVVEQGPTDEVLEPPFHPYTRLLISSVPELRIGWLEDTMKKREMAVGIAPGVETLFESTPAFREVLHELEQPRLIREKGQDLTAMIREEIKHLEEDIALRTQYINSLLDRLQTTFFLLGVSTYEAPLILSFIL